MTGTVVVTASTGSFPGLIEALRAVPISAEECPLITFAPPVDWGAVDAAIRNLARYDAVAFTSPRSARAFAGRLAAAGTGGGDGLPKVWAAGAGTADALGDVLGTVRWPDEGAVGRDGAAGALAEALMEEGTRGPVLFPCGDIRRDELPARLRDGGIVVEELVCYRSVLAGETDARRAAERAQVLVVASPSVADLLARACPPGSRPALVAVGPTTADAARASGWPPERVAARPTTEALTAAIRALMAGR
ncbi:MAG TPA: uroporphyrinogen-III synthase [Gemmatimonadales bacterium]|nr:uroporphyrinogen-III synthase [Gemmatimonadales bacterium]